MSQDERAEGRWLATKSRELFPLRTYRTVLLVQPLDTRWTSADTGTEEQYNSLTGRWIPMSLCGILRRWWEMRTLGISELLTCHEGRRAWHQGFSQVTPGKEQRPDFEQCLLSHEVYSTWETSGRRLPTSFWSGPRGITEQIGNDSHCYPRYQVYKRYRSREFWNGTRHPVMPGVAAAATGIT
ncbi:surfactant-associated protein 2 isoform X4 [Arvicanthis niloticus]|uniref:surfactant-associated protein 2 isoform X4 n=1 Tax=Arvicanthis niloticus TaxID=61156 RepID=UPI00402BE1A6